jgi:rubrerythrin
MAVPVIEPFDPSPFIRSRGQIISGAINTIGKAASTAVEAEMKAAKESDSKKAHINEIINVEGEHWDTTNKMYGDTTVEPVMTPEAMEQIEQSTFTRVTPESKQRLTQDGVPQKTVISKNHKLKQQYLRGLQQQLESGNYSKEDLVAYKAGRGNYLKKKDIFVQEYGKDAVQWVEPTVDMYMADPFAEKTFDKPAKDFIEAKTNSFITQKIKQYMNLPEVKEASKLIESGQTPTSKAGTKEGFYEWFIESSGAPDSDRVVNEEGVIESIEPNVNEGRYGNKAIRALGKADYRLKVDAMFDSHQQRISQNLRRQEIEARQQSSGTSAAERKEKQDERRQNRLDNIFTKTAGTVTSKITKTQDKINRMSAALAKKKEQIPVVDPEFADESMEELTNKITLAQTNLIDSQNENEIVEALGNLRLSDPSIRGESFDPVRIRNLRKEIYDDVPDNPSSLAGRIKQVIFGDDPQQPGGAPNADDLDARIIGNEAPAAAPAPQPAQQDSVRVFNTVEEAEAANLTPGTIVQVGQQKFRVE